MHEDYYLSSSTSALEMKAAYLYKMWVPIYQTPGYLVSRHLEFSFIWQIFQRKFGIL
jgi:hypothetical protein